MTDAELLRARLAWAVGLRRYLAARCPVVDALAERGYPEAKVLWARLAEVFEDEIACYGAGDHERAAALRRDCAALVDGLDGYARFAADDLASTAGERAELAAAREREDKLRRAMVSGNRALERVVAVSDARAEASRRRFAESRARTNVSLVDVLRCRAREVRQQARPRERRASSARDGRSPPRRSADDDLEDPDPPGGGGPA